MPGHPFCPTEIDLTKVCTKLYAKGFRNPFRFHLRPGAGPVVGDVGWELREELDVTRPGRSYGWPCYEGDDPDLGLPGHGGLRRGVRRRPDAHEPPSYEYARTRGGRNGPGRSALRGRRSTRPSTGARGSSATTRRA